MKDILLVLFVIALLAGLTFVVRIDGGKLGEVFPQPGEESTASPFPQVNR